MITSALFMPLVFYFATLLFMPFVLWQRGLKKQQQFEHNLISIVASKFLLNNHYVDNYWVKTIRNKETITLQLLHKTYQAEWKEKGTSLEHFSYFYKQHSGQKVKPSKKRGKFVSTIVKEKTLPISSPDIDIEMLDVASDMKLQAEELNLQAREQIITEIMAQTNVVNITQLTSKT